MQDQDSQSNDTKDTLEILNRCAITPFLPLLEQVYGASFEKMIEKINREILNKYPDPIELGWEEFSKKSV